jgi:16S rRNA (cytosine967-C5)-methyltransferase
MTSPARSAAFYAFRSVTQKKASLPQALNKTRQNLSDKRDRSLAADIVTGTLRWQGMLDHVIQECTHRPNSKLDPRILDLLRISAYQIFRQDRVPIAAIVNDAVNLTREIGRAHAAGFVNAVLRSLTRVQHEPPLPAQPDPEELAAHENTSFEDWPQPLQDATLDYLSTTESHPRWLVERWIIRYGYSSTLAWARFNNTPAPLTLRTNRIKTDRDTLIKELEQHAVHVTPTSHAPDGLIVLEGNPLHTTLAQSGKFFLQSETSQLISCLANVQSGQQVLDTCAAPGGKTTALAADMNNTGFLVATDVRKSRLALLAKTIRYSGATNIRLAQADFVAGAPFLNSFDCVVVDAPCTGLGTIRTDPDIRWRCQPNDFSKTTEIQLSILEQASQAVRSGGSLLYSTCSSEPEENEEVIDSFLKLHPKFSILDAKSLKDRLGVTLTSAINSSGHLRTYPFLHGLDAFFAAVLISD